MASRRSVYVCACVILMWTAIGVGAQEPACASDHTPRNIDAHISVKKHIAELLTRSPTLRRQYARIAATPRVAVKVILLRQLTGPGRARTTMFKYEAGFIRALVEIPVGPDLVELLAHELEHVIEQIDGVDLRALARAGQAHAIQYDGLFETTRAREAGLAAAREVSDVRRQRVSQP